MTMKLMPIMSQWRGVVGLDQLPEDDRRWKTTGTLTTPCVVLGIELEVTPIGVVHHHWVIMVKDSDGQAWVETVATVKPVDGVL